MTGKFGIRPIKWPEDRRDAKGFNFDSTLILTLFSDGFLYLGTFHIPFTLIAIKDAISDTVFHQGINVYQKFARDAALP